ncbi:MAG: hypothetical protein D6680_20735 [Cyanobacteria bacterium J007]|nr:MAG: hypothetical protein D6680_20735 [Cyanobacteria bacterium J007]
MTDLENQHQTTQFIAAIVNSDNLQQAEALTTQLSAQDRIFLEAVGEFDKVREFVGTPEHILGSPATKHGEIAEQVEVGIHNAKSLLQGVRSHATFEGVGRTAPEDYLIDGVQVQSKFVNGIGNSLDRVLDHMRKYDYFGRQDSYYHIPKNHYETIDKILNGESVEGVSSRLARNVQEKAQKIEELSGHSFKQTVKPAYSNYEDVRIDKVEDTLARRQRELKEENENIKDSISDRAQPNLGDVGRVALKGAVLAGSMRFSLQIYAKYKQGKNVFKGELSREDWQEIGLDTVKGGALGGVSATAIYGLTNFANLSAPLAGAFTSATLEIASLIGRLNSGEITGDRFVELSLFACADSAIVAAGAILGQAIIPIPVVGIVIGAIAGRMVTDICKNLLGQESSVIEKIEKYDRNSIATVDREYRAIVADVLVKYERLGNLAQAAFDPALNLELRLQASIELAEAYEVADDEILHNIDELDGFMLG